jgi:glycine/D-amino acid oxidase-like deaminating enzyme
VTVFEATQPASAATGRSFGWINASFYANPAHHRLRVASMQAWRRQQTALPDPAPNWQGCLWWEDQGEAMARMADDLTALGYPVDHLSGAEVAALEPQLPHPPAGALRFPTEGAVEPAAMTRALLAASGAKLLSGLFVKSLIETSGQITGVRTAIGPFKADHVILATGTATPDLLAPLGLHLPMLTRPGVLLHSKPVPWRLNHIIVTPDQEIRQDAAGHILAPAVANHQADTADSVPDPHALIDATLHRLADLFGAHLEMDRYVIGYRPVPADGLPVVGTVQAGLSIAVMHSGITLAAGIAEALSAELTAQGESHLLADFRPARLLTTAP